MPRYFWSAPRIPTSGLWPGPTRPVLIIFRNYAKIMPLSENYCMLSVTEIMLLRFNEHSVKSTTTTTAYDPKKKCSVPVPSSSKSNVTICSCMGQNIHLKMFKRRPMSMKVDWHMSYIILYTCNDQVFCLVESQMVMFNFEEAGLF